MTINNLQIDTTDLPAGVVNRNFTVTGEPGARFRIIALQNPSSSSNQTLYYDFKNNSFESGHNNLDNNLEQTLTGTSYSKNIIFPASAGEFVVKLMGIGGTLVQGSASNVITKNITKLGSDATVTFTPGTSSVNATAYATLPTSTSTGAVNSSGGFSFNWDVTNSTTESGVFGGFGFRLLDPLLVINDKFWYCTTTDTVDGAVSSGTTVVLDDITDIGVGSIITGVSAGSLSGTPRITAIDTDTKTLTLDSAQTFSDGITLTFKAYGVNNIKKAIGMVVSFEKPTVTPTTLTKTVRTDVSNATITLNGTYGVSGGGFVSIFGVGVDNSDLIRVCLLYTSPSPRDS